MDCVYGMERGGYGSGKSEGHGKNLSHYDDFDTCHELRNGARDFIRHDVHEHVRRSRWSDGGILVLARFCSTGKIECRFMGRQTVGLLVSHRRLLPRLALHDGGHPRTVG